MLSILITIAVLYLSFGTGDYLVGILWSLITIGGIIIGAYTVRYNNREKRKNRFL